MKKVYSGILFAVLRFNKDAVIMSGDATNRFDEKTDNIGKDIFC